MSDSANLPTALITGANRGLGFETARQLAGRGFRVVLAARDVASARQAAESISVATGLVEVLELDVSDQASIDQASDQLGRLTDRLEVLVNNAGIYIDDERTILNVSPEQLHKTLQTNTLGPLAITQAVLPLLRQADQARVVNLSSSYGQREGLSSGVPAYCLSKFALNGITIMLADALRSEGIAVNAVCPGWVRTAMGGPGASLSVERGADTIVWLAADAPQKFTGKMFRNRQEIPW